MTGIGEEAGHGSAPPGVSRLDALLVSRGLARSRGEARDLVHAGAVVVAGLRSPKPSSPVEPDTRIDVREQPRFVGRAAHKLAGALDAFGPRGLRVAGRRCIDVGASTGGFTQVLLAAGAREVVAVDVGRGQLAAEVARDARVVERSGVNIRDVTATDLGGTAGVVVADLSFISLCLVMARLAELLEPPGEESGPPSRKEGDRGASWPQAGGDLVVLVKPQFEVGRSALGKSGVVRSAGLRERALREVVAAARAAGLVVAGVAPSPVRGGSGNREYLLWCTRPGRDSLPDDADVEREIGVAIAAGVSVEG